MYGIFKFLVYLEGEKCPPPPPHETCQQLRSTVPPSTGGPTSCSNDGVGRVFHLWSPHKEALSTRSSTRGRHRGTPIPVCPPPSSPRERSAPDAPIRPAPYPGGQEGTTSRGNPGPQSQQASPSKSRQQQAFGRRQPDAISQRTRCLLSTGKRGKGGLPGGGGAGARFPLHPVREAHSAGCPHSPAGAGGRQAGRREGRDPDPARGRRAGQRVLRADPTAATSAGSPPLLQLSGPPHPPLSGLVCGAPRNREAG